MSLPALAYDASWPRMKVLHKRFNDGSQASPTESGGQGWRSGLLPASPGKGSHRIGPRGEETPKSPVGAELLTSHSLGYSSFLPLGPG